jgi:hypothetical protein
MLDAEAEAFGNIDGDSDDGEDNDDEDFSEEEDYNDEQLLSPVAVAVADASVACDTGASGGAHVVSGGLVEDGGAGGSGGGDKKRLRIEGCGARSVAPPAASNAAGDAQNSMEDQHAKALPLNFSRIQAPLLTLEAGSLAAAKHPAYASAPVAVVEIVAGQMLYLPAGWFHEVTSQSSVEVTSQGGVEGSSHTGVPSAVATAPSEGRAGHMALNYWVHPPDVNIVVDDGGVDACGGGAGAGVESDPAATPEIETTTGATTGTAGATTDRTSTTPVSFEKPYRSGYWLDHWQTHYQHKYQQG